MRGPTGSRPHFMSLAFLLATSLLASLGPGPEQARPLEWSAPNECPDAAWIERRIEALGGQLGPGLAARATVERHDGVLRLDAQIESLRGRGELQLSDPSCEVLATAFALAVAMSETPAAAVVAWEAVDGAAAPAGPVVQPPEPPEPPELPESATSPDRSETVETQDAPTTAEDAQDPVFASTELEPLDRLDSPPPSSERSVRVFAGASAGIGLMPSFEVPLSLGVGWRRRSFELEGAAVYMPPGELRRGAQALARMTGVGGQARACWAPHLGRARREGGAERRGALTLPLCGVGEIGWMRVRGLDVAEAQRADSLWSGLGLSVALRVRLAARWSLSLDLLGLGHTSRPALAFAGEPPSLLFQPSPVAGRAGLRIEAHFGGLRKSRQVAAHNAARLFSGPADQSPPVATLP